MPLYTIVAQAGSLSPAARAKLAADVTELHVEMAGTPRNWVHVVFLDYPPGSGFIAGEPAPTVSATVAIRSGRDPGYKRRLLQRLWDLVQEATGAETDQIVIGLQELPASNAMELGRTMPDVA